MAVWHQLLKAFENLAFYVTLITILPLYGTQFLQLTVKHTQHKTHVS